VLRVVVAPFETAFRAVDDDFRHLSEGLLPAPDGGANSRLCHWDEARKDVHYQPYILDSITGYS
jgi:hypothetical protein